MSNNEGTSLSFLNLLSLLRSVGYLDTYSTHYHPRSRTVPIPIKRECKLLGFGSMDSFYDLVDRMVQVMIAAAVGIMLSQP